MLLKRSLTALVLFAVISVAPFTAAAADAEGKYAVRGVGSMKCSQLLSALESKDQNMHKDAVMLNTSWLNGYLSYVNRVEKDTYDIIPLTDSAQLLAVIIGKCRNNPDALVETISSQVIALLAKAKVSTESPLVAVKVGDMKGNFRKATLVALQEKLIALGYLKGKADGDFGTGSQKALRAYQKAEKIKETGFPDTDSVMRLLLK